MLKLKTAKRTVAIPRTYFEWCWETQGAEGEQFRRVWLNDWPHDQFEIVDGHRFKQIESVCRQFAIPLKERMV